MNVNLTGELVVDEPTRQTVLEHWKQGLSMGQIADIIRVTRSTVAGILRRLREHNVEMPTHRDVKKKRKPKTAAKFLPKPPLPPKEVDPPVMYQRPEGEITIVELEPHHCKAVVGRSEKADLPLYCGEQRLEGTSYCLEHAKEYRSMPRPR